MNTQIFTKAGAGIVSRVLTNKHTSGAAIVYLAAKYGAKLGAIWLPQHKDQFDQTADLIESFAVGYGLIMAGDSNATPPNAPTQ